MPYQLLSPTEWSAGMCCVVQCGKKKAISHVLDLGSVVLVVVVVVAAAAAAAAALGLVAAIVVTSKNPCSHGESTYVTE